VAVCSSLIANPAKNLVVSLSNPIALAAISVTIIRKPGSELGVGYRDNVGKGGIICLVGIQGCV